MDNQDQTVTINIPVDDPKISAPEVPETVVNTQEPVKTEENMIQIDAATAPVEPQVSTELPKEPIIEKPKEGRPCEYCKRKDEIDKITISYLQSARDARKIRKPFIPYQQELADMLDIDNDTLYQWTIKKKVESDELEHPEFTGLIKRLNTLKELLLLKRTTGRFNCTGAIFQLKTKHGYIETEKKLLASDAHEPLKIEIVEINKNEE